MFNKYPELSSKLFNKVYIECYGRQAFHSDLESYLKRTKACINLTPKHLQKIFSDESWNYSRTWGVPNDEQISDLVKKIKDDLKFVYKNNNVKNAERNLIKNMVGMIKNIEIVSIILAFLIPEKYCIIAPPPEHMIGFRRSSDKVETLLSYFDDIQKLAGQFKMGVFDMEKSLWTIHQLRYKIPEYDKKLTDELWSEYLNDVHILHLRVKNLLNELWGENINDDLKSKILKEKDPGLALILAMRYLERNMWDQVSKKVQQSRLDELVQSAKKGNILAKLMEVADTDPHLRKKVDQIWRKRNTAMHPSKENSDDISVQDVEEAIELNKLIGM